MSNLLPKDGVSALAYHTPDAATHLPCLLLVKYSARHMQATISLQFAIPIHGFTDAQSFTFVYDADNLVAGDTTLGPATAPLPQAARLAEITRAGNPRLKLLSLNIKKPCPIWCPPHLESIAHKRGFDAPYRQLVALAGATKVHVLFDHNWLHQNNHASFQCLISHPERLTGCPAATYLKTRYRQADWSVFSPVEDTSSEAPPAYTDASKKRPRQTVTSSTPESPFPKRILFSPVPFLTLSPTEKATTASTPSSKQPSSPLDYASGFQEAINNAVEKLLPDALQAILPAILPSMLARMFTAPPSSPSLSPPPKSKPHRMSFLNSPINAHVATLTQAHLQRYLDETLDQAAYQRGIADGEFNEVLDEHRLDVALVKDDNIAELNRLFEDKVNECKQIATDIVDEMEQHAEEVCGNVCNRLDRLLDKERLRRESEILQEAQTMFTKERNVGWDRTGPRGRRRRAISSPI